LNDKELKKLLDAIKELSNISNDYFVLCGKIVQYLTFFSDQIENGWIGVEKLIPVPQFSLIDELASPRYSQRLLSMRAQRSDALSKIGNVFFRLRWLAEHIIETMNRNERIRSVITEEAIESAFKVAYQDTEKKIEIFDQSAGELPN
jgi:hypothetical protein